jgi:hypothetical protein
MARSWLLAAVLLAAAAPLRAQPEQDFFRRAAREIARVSPKAHVRSVAVRSFTAANGGGSGTIGEGAAVRLVAALVHEGAPSVLHASPKTELPDAFVSGSYLPIGPDRVQLTVTMTSAVSGRPLYSEWKVVRNEWGEDGPRLGVGVRRREAAPDISASGGEEALEEAAGSCKDWERRADALQRAVLLPKARYWAQRYWAAKPEKALSADPARLITSKALAKEFDRSLRFWLAQREVPKLTPDEVRSMVNADLATESILDGCAPQRTVAHR